MYGGVRSSPQGVCSHDWACLTFFIPVVPPCFDLGSDPHVERKNWRDKESEGRKGVRVTSVVCNSSTEVFASLPYGRPQHINPGNCNMIAEPGRTYHVTEIHMLTELRSA